MLHVHVDGELAFPRSFEMASVVVAPEDAGRIDSDPVGVFLVDFQQDIVLELLAANTAKSRFSLFIMHVSHVIRQGREVQRLTALITVRGGIEERE